MRPRKISTPHSEADAPAVEAPELPRKQDTPALPTPDQIDPRTIKKAVLTTDGWVCPAEIRTAASGR